MTTPAATAQQPQLQQPQQPQHSTAEELFAAALAVALLNAISVGGVMAMLSAELGAMKLSMPVMLKVMQLRQDALSAAIGLLLEHPPGQDGFHGNAGRAMARQNLMSRVFFAVNSAKRLTQAVIEGRSRGINPLQALAAALPAERRYYAQHLLAIWGRQRAGAQVDSAAMLYGRLLGWHTVRDRKTSAECLSADGKNFFADSVPLIGYPGAVHPHCRCMPGRPFPGAALLPSYTRRAA